MLKVIQSALAIAMLMVVQVTSAQQPATTGTTPPVATLVLGTDQTESTFVGKWQRQIYAEAFRRIGVRVTFETLPPPRLTALVEAGEIDGEAARTMEYGAAHSSLVRVDESVFSIVFAIYTADQSLQLDGLKALPPSVVVEYRRGVLGCENVLKAVVPPLHLSDILTTEQGLRKLVAMRTDLYCDIELAVLNEMSAAKVAEFATVRKLFDVGAATALYPYLHRKNANLAPGLAAALRKMKAEGSIDRFRREAIRELGQK